MLTGRFVRVDLDEDGESVPASPRLVAACSASRWCGRRSCRRCGCSGATSCSARRSRQAIRARARSRAEGLSLLLRHAGRGRAHHGRRRALSAGLRATRSRRSSQAARGDDLMARPGISIKLSALHPRYELAQHAAPRGELLPRVDRARWSRRAAGNIAVTIDAEESRPARACRSICSSGWRGRAELRWLGRPRPRGPGLSEARDPRRSPGSRRSRARQRRRIPVRLVKGAYWDTEIKRAQELGLRRTIRCSRASSRPTSPISPARGGCWPAAERSIRSSPPTTPRRSPASSSWPARRSAASSSSACTAWARRCTRAWRSSDAAAVPCRVYAPVGSHEDLLPYLVRRLLENGANTSFVNRILDDARSDREVGRGPGDPAGAHPSPSRTRAFRCRATLYGAERRNSTGHRPARPGGARRAGPAHRCAALDPDRLRRLGRRTARAGAERALRSGRRARAIGSVIEADAHRGRSGAGRGRRGFADWDREPVERARAASSVRRICTRPARRSCWRCACARPARPWSMPWPRCARRSTFCATTRPRRARVVAAPGPAGPDRREQRIGLHGRGVFVCDQPLELSARDLHRPDRGGARGRQCGGRQARAADAADRGPRGRSCCTGRRARRTC